MFGKTKKADISELIKQKQKEAEAKAPTPVIEAKAQLQAPEPMAGLDLVRFLVAEFSGTYMGFVSKKDLENVDPEVLSLNLLFAIYGELRLARLARDQK